MAEWLKKARNMSGLSAQKLANACGYSLSYIQRIENGERAFSERARQTICHCLGFSPDDISLDFDELAEEVEKLIEQDGIDSFCLVRYIRRNGHKILIDFHHWNGSEAEISYAAYHPNIANVQVTPLMLRFAREEVTALRTIYENPILES